MVIRSSLKFPYLETVRAYYVVKQGLRSCLMSSYGIVLVIIVAINFTATKCVK